MSFTHITYIGGEPIVNDFWLVISIEIVITVVLVTCLVGIHVFHVHLKKKLTEIADNVVGVHENEAYGFSQHQHTVNVNRRRDTLEETSNSPSPEHTNDTADRIVSQNIPMDNIHIMEDHAQLPITVQNSGSETIEHQSEDNDIQHEYQYIDINRLGMLGDRDEEIELKVNNAYGLSRSVQRTHACTQAEHHDQRELVYESVLL